MNLHAEGSARRTRQMGGDVPFVLWTLPWLGLATPGRRPLGLRDADLTPPPAG